MIVALEVWWIANTITTITSKSVMNSTNDTTTWTSAFEDWRWVDLTVLQHILASGIAVVWAKLNGVTVWPAQGYNLVRPYIFVVALGNVIGSLATNAAYVPIESSTVQVAKVCEQLFTFVFTLLLYKNHSTFEVYTLLSVVIIVLGAGTFIMKDTTCNIHGIAAVMASNAFFPVRNICLKKLSKVCDSPLQKFAVMSFFSVIFLQPVLFIKIFITQQVLNFSYFSEIVLSSVFNFAYNLASVTVLDSFNPITHGILNVFERLFVIIANIVYFNTSLSWSMLISLIVVSVGCCLYQLRNSSIGKYMAFKHVLLSLLLVYFVTSQLSRNELKKESRLSTAWVFDRPIPKIVVTNIQNLSKEFPDTPIYVYCGTSQCIQSISNLNNDNIVAVFSVIPHILKGTPLENWIARHAFNKVLAGKEFENHLQEAVRLGILWNYGGFYVDPTVQITHLSSSMHSQCVDAWVTSARAEADNEDFPELLDVSCFSRGHPFVYRLAEQFVSEYPTKQSKNSIIFGFRKVLIQNIYKKPCNMCPITVYNANLKRIDLTRTIQKVSHFGTSSYNGIDSNLENEMQSLSAIQYLPFVDKFIERDKLSHMNNTTVFFSGHLLSHIDESVRKKAFKHIGCLKKRNNGLPKYDAKASYMIVMMSNPEINNRLQMNNIYLADVKPEIANLLPKEILKNSIYVEHNLKDKERLSRFQAAYKLMEIYGSAKLVITQHIYTALACVGMGTPVIFISPGTSGEKPNKEEDSSCLTGLFHTLDLYTVTTDEAKVWIRNFSRHGIPPNPNISMMMQLRISTWNIIRQDQALYDAAKKFGVIPMSLPPVPPQHRKLLFHLIFTTSNDSMVRLFTKGRNQTQRGYFNWRHMRCVEAIFYHHPTAEVIIHSNTLLQGTFDVLTEAGYSVTVKNYQLAKLLKDSPAHDFVEKLNMAQNMPHWYSHQTDLLRLLVLYKWGGIYLDTDMILVRSLDSLGKNVIGFEHARSYLCGAFMMFEKEHSYLKSCLIEFVQHYNGKKWTMNGPDLLTRVWRNQYQDSNDIHTKSKNVFYMFHYSVITSDCFNIPSEVRFKMWMSILKNTAYSVHLNSKITGNIGITSKLKNGSICSHILNSYCVLCNE